MLAVRSLIGYLVLLLACMPLAVTAATPTPVFRLHLPAEVAPEQATLIIGQYGQGLTVQSKTPEKGRRDYQIPLGEKTSRIRLLLCCPGCRTVTANLSRAEAALPFTLRLEPLPVTPLRLRIVDSQGRGLPGKRCSLRIDLATHRYFGYIDGYAYFATIGSGVTGADGSWPVSLPVLLDDPYFGKPADRAAMRLELVLEGAGRGDASVDISPDSIPLRRRYTDPLVVTLVKRAHLHGSIAIAAVRDRGLRGTVTPYEYEDQYSHIGPTRVELRAESGTVGPSHDCMLLRDGTFSARLPPGTYDLALVEIGKGGKVTRVLQQSGRAQLGETYMKRVPLGIRVTLREEDDRLITLR